LASPASAYLRTNGALELLTKDGHLGASAATTQNLWHLPSHQSEEENSIQYLRRLIRAPLDYPLQLLLVGCLNRNSPKKRRHLFFNIIAFERHAQAATATESENNNHAVNVVVYF
jgi:hypothetical protein